MYIKIQIMDIDINTDVDIATGIDTGIGIGKRYGYRCMYIYIHRYRYRCRYRYRPRYSARLGPLGLGVYGVLRNKGTHSLHGRRIQESHFDQYSKPVCHGLASLGSC